MKLFVDTWGWLELNNKRSHRYGDVEKFYRQFLQKRGWVYTTDYVLDETITLFFQRLPYSIADESLRLIEQSISANVIRLEQITAERFERAKELRRLYKDKPRISFTDLTSMAVMSELGITDVLTEDDHFIHAGLGFNKVP
ncbi:MAG: type II toxin-antitoxin system VapC family toxin [Blastocatellia bacterium]